MRTVCSLGPVRGKTGKYGLCFLGVPYGKARRFQPAMPCDPWIGERDCTHFGPFAFETDEKENEWQTHGEDCLNLNIFTPSCEGSRPVLVNLHGGAFQNGAADRVEPFSGEFVYVDVNYRLGVWGFLQIGASSGNNGIGDQILALQWIQREIACFGGDPRRVTVMGLSAGAKSIGALLAAPAARVLFSQAILSSGGTQSIRSRKTAGHIAREFFRFAGCESDPSVLFTMKNEDLLRAQRQMCAGRNSTCLFGPVADGVIIPENWEDELYTGREWQGRILIGSNRYELFADEAPRLQDQCRDLYGDNTPLAWRAADALLTGKQPDEAAVRTAWHRVHTDFMYRYYTDLLAGKLGKFLPVWNYSFDFLPATHGFDHGVLFDDCADFPAEKRADFEKMRDILRQIYISFTLGETPSAEGMPVWTMYRAPEYAKMHLDIPCRMESHPQGDSLQGFPPCVIVREEEEESV